MPFHNLGELSESEEMYLVSILKLMDDGVVIPIPLSMLAQEMDILSVSVNQMIKKLSEMELVIYTPYKGVSFTEKGQNLVSQIIRRRRLWKVFLVDKLGVPFAEADELACRLEHITPASITNHLDQFLGFPEIDPSGKIIPESESVSIPQNRPTLNQLKINQIGQIVGIKNNPAIQSFLANERILIGTEIKVLGIGTNGSALVENDSSLINISEKVSSCVFVKLIKS